ncbi:hypothetical protein ACPC39_24050 [Streptomyces cellulosae]
MGERQSDGGRAGRRRVHPERSGRPVGVAAGAGRAAPVSVEGPAGDTARLEALLVHALVSDALDTGAEQRAVAAFVAARESGAHGARTRRQDDWRVSRRRFGGRSLRVTLGALVSGCALSGVAWAGIQVVGVPGGERSEEPRPSRTPSASSAPAAPVVPDVSGDTGAAETPEASPSASVTAEKDGERRGSGRADPGKSVEAHCRAYERVAGRGRALEAPVWERLVAAAGGAGRVEAYCDGIGRGVAPSDSASAAVSVPPVEGETVGTGASDVVREGVGVGRKP